MKKKLLLGLAILATLTGGWLYYALYLSSSSAIQLAEAFLFRRMTVAQLGEQNVYRYFVATNREIENPKAPPDEVRGTQRSGALRFGSFDTKIEPTLGLGMLVNPTDWFQNQAIQLRNPADLNEADFVADLRAMVARSPHRGLLLVVHGFRESFPSALRKTAFIGHVLDINAPVLLFDWPGNQGSTPAGYRRAHAVAEESGAELAQLLDLVVREVRPERLWVWANSMGGEVVTSAFDTLYQQGEWADDELEIEDVILTAPDVSADDFDTKFRDKIQSLTENLTVYVSSNDRALIMSRIINRGERRKGESTLSLDQVMEAERVLELTGDDKDQITLVDVTPVNRTRNFHNFSLETPEFFDDLFLRLINEEMPDSRLVYQVKTSDGKAYWVLTRGR
ncbi:MAG: alpha/beta hydrolase [Gammaproteobacteria bacterium]